MATAEGLSGTLVLLLPVFLIVSLAASLALIHLATLALFALALAAPLRFQQLRLRALAAAAALLNALPLLLFALLIALPSHRSLLLVQALDIFLCIAVAGIAAAIAAHSQHRLRSSSFSRRSPALARVNRRQLGLLAAQQAVTSAAFSLFIAADAVLFARWAPGRAVGNPACAWLEEDWATVLSLVVAVCTGPLYCLRLFADPLFDHLIEPKLRRPIVHLLSRFRQ